MRLVIEVRHIVSFDPQVIAILEQIFPNKAFIDGLTKDITAKTGELKSAIETSAPTE